VTATTTQVPAVTDYLVAAAKASPLLGAASPPAYVFDGPQPPVATQSLERVLWIGADPLNPEDIAAEATQNWPVMDHARTRDEDGSITCAAQHWSGDPASKVHRDGAAAIVAGVELLLRGDTLAGGPGDASMGGLVMWSGVDGPFQWGPRQVANGAAMLVTFRITYRARLTTS
jgi:hypothetical protein